MRVLLPAKAVCPFQCITVSLVQAKGRGVGHHNNQSGCGNPTTALRQSLVMVSECECAQTLAAIKREFPSYHVYNPKCSADDVFVGFNTLLLPGSKPQRQLNQCSSTVPSQTLAVATLTTSSPQRLLHQ